jgi:hypothetical protein
MEFGGKPATPRNLRLDQGDHGLEPDVIRWQVGEDGATVELFAELNEVQVPARRPYRTTTGVGVSLYMSAAVAEELYGLLGEWISGRQR